MNLETKITIYKFTPQLFTLTQNEELQSRREFFKRAAKGALPILAGAALLSSPILSETANAMSCAGCNNRCMNSCFNTCHGTCSRTCSGTYK